MLIEETLLQLRFLYSFPVFALCWGGSYCANWEPRFPSVYGTHRFGWLGNKMLKKILVTVWRLFPSDVLVSWNSEALARACVTVKLQRWYGRKGLYDMESWMCPVTGKIDRVETTEKRRETQKKKKQWWRRTRCEYVSCYITHIRRHKNTQGQQRGEHTKKAFLWFKKEKKSTKGELIIKKSTAMCVWRKSDNKLCMIQHRQERGSVKQTLGDMKVLLGWGRMYISFYFSHQNFKPCGLQAL